MLKKTPAFLFLIFLFVSLVAPLAALAQGSAVSKIPEFNPLCWKKDECEQVRIKFGAEKKDAAQGWVKNPQICAGDWGMCLPAGKTTTQIAFGGRKDFENVGEFIAMLYKYALQIAAILAVIVIIIAGVQWTTSGGNSERITSAKKRIFGALIGLFIAYMSYFILHAINPATVDLRLPQVYMIKEQTTMPQYCLEAPKGTKFSVAALAKDQVSPVKIEKPDYNLKLESDNDKNFYCGNRYFMEKGGAATCWGNYCPKGKVCFDVGSSDKQQPNYCADGMLAGKIPGTLGLAGAPVVDNNNDAILIAICEDPESGGTAKNLLQVGDKIDVDEKGRSYIFPVKNVEKICKNGADPVGFYLGVEVNDESGATGRFMEGMPFSWGIDDWMAVGQAGPGSHSCSVNLSKALVNAGNDNCKGAKDARCSCSYIYSYSELKLLNGVLPLIKKYLITVDELKRGYLCDIKIDRGEFPAIDNATAGTIMSSVLGWADKTDCLPWGKDKTL
ncbi:hypothetical protein EPN28_00780 [Patescibacteria group bacterium]|nr:MAG: hypothetical protein EPN28_00780 [Patescibacteria group bacterium]